jgi:formate dehydrogenase subunit gamma
LNISRAELHGVISFYHDFRANPAGRHVLKICRAEACQAVGGAALAEATLKKLGLEWHGTTANGAVTVEPVYCLGLCACAPAVMLDDRVVGRLDGARMDALLAEAGA